MLLNSLTPVESYSFNQLSDIIYKISIRENIKDNGNYYSFDEYTLITEINDKDIDQNIKDNLEKYLEIAKLNDEERKKQNQIENYKKQLTNSDYKVIKCFEKYMIGNTLPYEFSSLISTRTDIRDKINELDGTTDGEDSTQLTVEKNKKITEMCSASQFTITNGVDYNEKHFSLNTYDQINLTTLGALAQQGQSVPYHADGELCTVFTAEEMLGLITVATNWIVYHTTYFNLLKHQIDDMTSIDDVRNCYYGMELTGVYKQILDGITSQSK